MNSYENPEEQDWSHKLSDGTLLHEGNVDELYEHAFRNIGTAGRARVKSLSDENTEIAKRVRAGGGLRSVEFLKAMDVQARMDDVFSLVRTPTKMLRGADIRRWIDVAKRARVIVFDKSLGAGRADDPDLVEANKIIIANNPIDPPTLPFDAIMIESTSGFPLWVSNETDFYTGASGAAGCYCWLIAENPDGTLKGFAMNLVVYRPLGVDQRAGSVIIECAELDLAGAKQEKILSVYLGYIRKSTSGEQNVSERIKLKSGKESEHFKISKIIRIKGKSTKTLATINGGREINWSHRWEVMGHWRKVPGIGKNKLGEPVLVGRTWVKDFVKGPEHMLIIKKTRVISNEL